MKKAQGFLGGMFDLSFTQFVTTRIVVVLYVLAIIFAALMSLVMLVGGLVSGTAAGVLMALIFAPLSFGLSVLSARVWLELIVVVFRIAENTGRMVECAEQTGGEAPTEPGPAEPEVGETE